MRRVEALRTVNRGFLLTSAANEPSSCCCCCCFCFCLPLLSSDCCVCMYVPVNGRAIRLGRTPDAVNSAVLLAV